MAINFSHTSSFTKIIIMIEFFLVAYLFYAFTNNIYKNYTIDQHTADFEEKNALIALENQQKNEDYLYFTSSEYIDKIAKQNLGLVNPGEKVIILSPDILDPDLLSDNENDVSDDLARYSGMSNSEQWWYFFFTE